MENRFKENDERLIRWVITVPAIWGEEAKQFMRQAAFKAKCIDSVDSEKLIIALEPEAASLCCRRISVADYANAKDIKFEEGTKYLVLDCGGGTVDIAAHIINKNESVTEIIKPSGGAWGGTQVDNNFENYFSELFGKNFMNTYINKYPKEWFQMKLLFETKKRAFHPDGKATINMQIPYNLNELYMEMKHESLKSFLEKSTERGVTFDNGLIIIAHDRVLSFFQPVVDKIVRQVRRLMHNSKLSGLSYIFMVGGFSECSTLQRAIKEAFTSSSLTILTPSGAQLAIIKGALLFGHKPRTEIAARIAKFTYGSAVSAPFDPKIHDEIYKRLDAKGELRCDDILHVFVEKDQLIEVGFTKTCEIKAPPDSSEESISLLCIDSLPSKPVQYINTPGIRELGKINIDTPIENIDRTMKVQIEFGDTQIKVSAKFVATGKQLSAKMDFEMY